jgi:predicted Zn-dependent protease
MSRARGDFHGEAQLENEVISIAPNLSGVALMHAVALMNAGDLAPSRAELLKLLAAFPRNRDVSLQLAALDLRAKRYHDAETEFRNLLGRDGSGAGAIAGLAETLRAEGQTPQALAFLQEELAKAGDAVQVRLILASFAGQAGQLDLAIEQYKHAIAAQGKSVPVCMRLGQAYARKRDFPNAIASFKDAGALAPDDPGPVLMLGDTLFLAGNKADAIAAYRHALALKPDGAEAQNGLAYALADAGGDLYEAQRLAQGVLDRNPREASYSDTLAWVYVKRNLADNAIQILHRIVRESPEKPSFHYHLAVALLQKGDRAGGRAELMAALSKKPSDEMRQSIENALSSLGKP